MFLKWVIGLIKGREVVIDKRVPLSYIFELSLSKAIMLMRGILKMRRFVFLGSSVSVKGASFISCGKGVEIGKSCSIDGLGTVGLKLGSGVKIGDFSVVKVSGTLTDIGESIILGDNVGIGEFAHIGGAGGVRIGRDTISGSYLSIHPENHVFDDPEILIRLQGVVRSGVVIGNNCWLGAKVTFLDGSGIGDRCVVAAGAVVTKVFPSGVLIAGCPAKVIREI
jgi:acetyltransferase-like isoleucine patch superfamily enzyme